MSIVRIRRANFSDDDTSAGAIVARIENHLKSNNLTAALDEVQNLPETSIKYIADWVSKLEARVAVEQAIANIEQELKASLSASAGKKG